MPFNLTPFAITLNDCPPTLARWLPPTDCRLRPDQRAFEMAEYEKANTLKGEQEDLQRRTRARRATGELPPHEPRWFSAQMDGDTGERVWQPSRIGGKVEYWVERRRATESGTPWRGVDEIFVS